jgi:hypothetical protein
MINGAIIGSLINVSQMAATITPSGPDITAGLLGWWKLNEGSGTNAADSSTNGNTGTVPNTWQIGGGPVYADSFSNPGGGGIVLSAPVVCGNSFTFCAWIFVVASTSYGNLWTQGTTKGLYYGSGGKLDWYEGSDKFSNGTIPTYEWHHVAMVMDAGVVTFYIDGVADSNTYSGMTGLTVSGFSCDNGNGGECLDSYIQDVRIYNRALNATEIGLVKNYTP